ncbi:MAG: hypothetical protein SGJ20_10695 [Planctomycetota bacterium]|nr:hypothetical protein [Planctomycetota bacterium]
MDEQFLLNVAGMVFGFAGSLLLTAAIGPVLMILRVFVYSEGKADLGDDMLNAYRRGQVRLYMGMVLLCGGFALQMLSLFKL